MYLIFNIQHRGGQGFEWVWGTNVSADVLLQNTLNHLDGFVGTIWATSEVNICPSPDLDKPRGLREVEAPRIF